LKLCEGVPPLLVTVTLVVVVLAIDEALAM
jgi:hypothetical protein